MGKTFQRPEALADTMTHYCPGCTHGVAHRLVAEVIDELITVYPGLSAERIAGHCDIAPQRKTDPGEAFDWQRLHARLAALQS